MSLVMDGLPEHLVNTKKLRKQLNEALGVCSKIEESVSWACDFTDFKTINNILEPIYDAVETAKGQLDFEIDKVESKIDNYYTELIQFDNEHAIEL